MKNLLCFGDSNTYGYDREFDENSVRVSKGLRDAYFSVAKKTGCDFLAASEFASPSAADREHLDRAGHRQLVKAIFGKIREAV